MNRFQECYEQGRQDHASGYGSKEGATRYTAEVGAWEAGWFATEQAAERARDLAAVSTGDQAKVSDSISLQAELDKLRRHLRVADQRAMRYYHEVRKLNLAVGKHKRRAERYKVRVKELELLRRVDELDNQQRRQVPTGVTRW